VARVYLPPGKLDFSFSFGRGRRALIKEQARCQ